MSNTTVTYKCKNCDAPLHFNAEKQLFDCEFCLSEFTEEELNDSYSAEQAERIVRENEEFLREVNEYHCPTCGAEIITDKSTVSDYCYYCHNPVVMTDKVSGVMKPTKIIPFKFDKAAAKDRFFKFVKNKIFLPRDYFVDAQAEKISGVYYPFWVTDADADTDLTANGRVVRSWTSGNYRYTETKNYAVKRGGFIHFEDITTSAISTEDKKMLEGILPYPLDAYEDFSMPYLLGYMSKKRDLDRDKLCTEVRERMYGYTDSLLTDTARGYSCLDNKVVGMNIRHSKWEYALLPIWILTYNKKGRKGIKTYTYAMNGYTGKVYGELPVSIPKLLSLFFGIFIGLGALISVIWRFLL